MAAHRAEALAGERDELSGGLRRAEQDEDGAEGAEGAPSSARYATGMEE